MSIWVSQEVAIFILEFSKSCGQIAVYMLLYLRGSMLPICSLVKGGCIYGDACEL